MFNPIRVVGLLIKGEKVLLGKRTEGLGSGNFVSIGGKQEEYESPEDTLTRELFEEIGVVPVSYDKVAEIEYIFPSKSTWNQVMFVYLVTKWKNKISTKEDVIPKWFDWTKIPFKLMWPDAKFWIPEILGGKKVKCKFIYNSDCKELAQIIIGYQKNL